MTPADQLRLIAESAPLEEASARLDAQFKFAIFEAARRHSMAVVYLEIAIGMQEAEAMVDRRKKPKARRPKLFPTAPIPHGKILRMFARAA